MATTYHQTPAGYAYRIERDPDTDSYEVQTEISPTRLGTFTRDGWACWASIEVGPDMTDEDHQMVGEQIDSILEDA